MAPASANNRRWVAPSTARLSLTLIVLGVASSAMAQEGPTISPPLARSSTEVPYPSGAKGNSVVSLEIVVAKDGTVSEAKVLDGEEPFAEQARLAVLRWEFTPAMRGAEPVAARIRARVEFHQVEAAASTTAGTAPSAGPAPASQPAATNGPPAVEAPLDVTVRGQRREIGQTTLSAADVREMPGAFGDPFRAIEALPGVSPILSGLPFFYIRGAPPNDNGYYVDGVRVPILFHVGIGEAVIHPALIDRVDFFPSAAPAAYGGWAGAFIAGQTREPATQAHGQANIRLFDAGGLVETPLDDGKGSVLLAGRYGYPGPILSAITSNVKLGYWDYQARATWRLTDHDTLGVFAFGSHDYLGAASSMNGVPGPIVEELGSDFHRVDLRYDHALAAGHLRIAATLGYDSQGGAGATDGAAPATIRDRSAAFRLEMNERFSAALWVRGGADFHYDTYDFEQAPPAYDQVPVPSSADPPPTNVSGGVHADVVWRLGSRVEIVPGARLDIFESSRSSPTGGEIRTTVPAFDPRLSARVAINSKLAWLITAGIAHQYPALRVGPIPAFLVTVPGFPFGDSQLQTARQLSTGVEASLPAEVSLTATGFVSSWTGLTDLNARCLQILPPTMPPYYGNPPPTPYTCPNADPVHGYAYGGELLIRRSLSKRLAGWLSYTLSQSRRDEHFVTLSGGDALANVTSDFDRTHIVNAILAYDLGRHWRAGARFVYYSGAPYSYLSGNVPVPPYNGYRGPGFYRLDVRLEKRWTVGKTGSIAFVLEGQNVTLSTEVSPEGLKCFSSMVGPTGGTNVTNRCSEGTIGPLTIPSIGVEASF
jgi:TonB family protein